MSATMADCEAAQTQQSNEGGGGPRTPSDTRDDDGCPLLVLTPMDESRHVFRRGRGRGYAAAAATSNWDFGWDWVTMTTLTTIQPRRPDTPFTRNNQID
jgi:hypothetical protein